MVSEVRDSDFTSDATLIPNHGSRKGGDPAARVRGSRTLQGDSPDSSACPSATSTKSSASRGAATRRSSRPPIRKLAMQFHPDRNNGDPTAEVKFKEVNEAYECLRDPQKRAAYDRFGHAAFENGGGPGFNTDFAAVDVEHLRRHLRRVHGRQPRAAATTTGRERGADLRYNMEITPRGGLRRQDGGRSRCRPRSSARPAPAPAPSAAPARAPAPPATAQGRVRVGPGLLLDRAHLPDLPGPRRGHLRPLPRLRRRRPRHRGAQALGQHSRRHRGRHAHPACRRRRGRAARRAGRATSTSSCRSSRMSSSSATARISSAACRSR